MAAEKWRGTVHVPVRLQLPVCRHSKGSEKLPRNPKNYKNPPACATWPRLPFHGPCENVPGFRSWGDQSSGLFFAAVKGSFDELIYSLTASSSCPCLFASPQSSQGMRPFRLPARFRRCRHSLLAACGDKSNKATLPYGNTLHTRISRRP